MNAFSRWFVDIYEGMTSAAIGMSVTFKHLFRKPVTVEYPNVNVEAQLPPRYRGILQVDMDICISCKLCENACPISCIAIQDVKGEKISVVSRTTGKPTPKLRYSTSFLIDMAKCMYCGLCVEPCPTGAIHHTTRFEGCVGDVASLTLQFVRDVDLKLAAEAEQKLKAAEEAAKK